MTNKKHENTTLEKIKENSKILFLEKGYSSTSISDICNVSNITKGSLFYYYHTKEELAIDVISDFFENFSSKLELKLKLIPSKDISILTYTDSLIELTGDIFLSKGCLVGNFIQEVWKTNSNLMNILRNYLSQWEKSIIEIFKKNLTKNEVDLDHISKLAKFLISVYEGGMILSKTYNNWSILSDMLKEFRNYMGCISK